MAFKRVIIRRVGPLSLLLDVFLSEVQMQLHSFCTRIAVAVLLVCALPCQAKTKDDTPLKTGIIFGSYNLCCSYVWQDYQLRLKKVGDKKLINVIVDGNRRYNGQFTFFQRLPPGKYYFYKFSATQADWSKEIYDKKSTFEVTEGKATYLGDWDFKIRPTSISFSVRYDKKSVASFFERNKEYSSNDLLFGIHGKSAVSPDIDQTIPSITPAN